MHKSYRICYNNQVMNLIETAPDRFNRFNTTSQWIKTLNHHLPDKPRILDIGSQENVFRELLPHCEVFHTDMKTATAGPFTQASILQLPFPDKSFDITICLDVLEHLDDSLRRSAVAEVLRITRSGTVFSFPHDVAANVEIETSLNRTHRAIFNADNPYLQEHRQFGLLPENTIGSLLTLIREQFSFAYQLSTQDQSIWLLSQILDYLMTQLPEASAIQTELYRCINSMLTKNQSREESYRTFLMGSQWDSPPNIQPVLSPVTSVSNSFISAMKNLVCINTDSQNYVAHLQTELHQLKTNYTQLESTYADTRIDVTASKEHIQKLVQENQAKSDRITTIDTAWQRLQEEYTQLQTAHTELEQKYLESTSERNNLKEQLPEIESYARHLETTIHQHEKSILTLQKKITHLLTHTPDQE